MMPVRYEAIKNADGKLAIRGLKLSTSALGGREEEIIPVCLDVHGKDNADLIVEAFNVSTETGMTPRDLVTEVERLEKELGHQTDLTDREHRYRLGAEDKRDELKTLNAELLRDLKTLVETYGDSVHPESDAPVIKNARKTIAKAGAA